MLVVDSTVWIDYFNGVETAQTNYLDGVLEHAPILVGDLILAEVLQGFRNDTDFEAARGALGKFMQANMVGAALALQAARNYRYLRSRGATVRKTIDSLIATYCLENDHELLHSDSDFDSYEQYLGLKVIHQKT